MKREDASSNIDNEVVDHFGKEWAKYNYLGGVASAALDEQFEAYVRPINFDDFDNRTAVAADFGAGSGRWTERLEPFFNKIYAVEPSAAAVLVMNEKFSNLEKIKVLHENIENNSIADNSLDFAISLGVLHHIPNTRKAIMDLGKKIKPGGTFLCYLYYKIENKPIYYRAIFSLVNIVRFCTSRMPHKIRMLLASFIALTVYLPFARLSRILLRKGWDISNIPLHHYAEMPFVMLENDALDRFGTRLEQRFNKVEIEAMLEEADFDPTTLKFSEVEPFWTFAVTKNILSRPLL